LLKFPLSSQPHDLNKSESTPVKNVSYQVWKKLTLDRRRTLCHGISSHGLWPDELKTETKPEAIIQLIINKKIYFSTFLVMPLLKLFVFFVHI